MAEPGMKGAGGRSGPGGAAQQSEQSAEPLRPSRLLCLKHLLSTEALADDGEFRDCTDDIKTECARFGTITMCAFPRQGDLGARL